MRGKRLFIGVLLPDYLKTSLESLQEKRRKGFHWVHPSRFHLTLRFIGDVPGQLQEGIEEALDGVKVEPFYLPVEGVGCFPLAQRAHAVWVGLGNGHPCLFQLKKQIEDRLFALGLEPEKRIYRPHITLARVNHAAPETVRQFLKENRDFAAPPFRVETFHLFHSQVLPEIGRVHEIEGTWTLET